FANAQQRRFCYALRRAGNGNHAPVVVGIGVPIEHAGICNTAHRAHKGVNFGSVVSLGEIGNALNQPAHRYMTTADGTLNSVYRATAETLMSMYLPRDIALTADPLPCAIAPAVCSMHSCLLSLWSALIAPPNRGL